AGTQRALILDDTDTARAQLVGAPLAAWRRLLAASVPGTDAIVMMARSGESPPFDEDELSTLIPTLHEASALFDNALQTRGLAPLSSVPLPRSIPALLQPVAESLMAPAIIGALGMRGELFRPYLLAPIVITGLMGGARIAAGTAVASTCMLVIGAAASALND